MPALHDLAEPYVFDDARIFADYLQDLGWSHPTLDLEGLDDLLKNFLLRHGGKVEGE